MGPRDLAVGLAGGRIAIGVVSLLAPGLVGRAMMGPDGDSGGTRLFLRVVGARDLALGLGVLVALDRDAPVQGDTWSGLACTPRGRPPRSRLPGVD